MAATSVDKNQNLKYSVGLAATVPWLDLLVSLLGAVKMSTLSLMAPALVNVLILVIITSIAIINNILAQIDAAVNWNTDTRSEFIFRSLKNSFVFVIGFLACVIGTYISLQDIIRNFQQDHPY